MISVKNYLLFHTVVEAFTIYVAYTIFLITWQSRNRLENRYLIVLGTGYFFIGSVEFLHTFAFNGMGASPLLDTNLIFSSTFALLVKRMKTGRLILAVQPPFIYKVEMIKAK
ncbi:MAG TPA: MASE3 domain-containing protein [Methanosarcina sp.]|nr:MASE3 domain-containing protein [Methanosarcina sp.]